MKFRSILFIKESSDKIHKNIVMHKGTLNIHSFVLIFVR